MCRSPFIYWLFLFFLWLFWGGGHPHRRGGGSVIGARRGAASCFIGAEGSGIGAVVSVVGGGMKKPLSVSERRSVF